jgi:microsomal dipeptidase-like Zn-dependent dipeptidase
MLHNRRQKIGGKVWRYRLVKNFHEIIENLSQNVISVIPTLEGAHLFTEDNSKPPVREEILENIDDMLSRDFKPFFVSPAHHFYNHIAGHAYSLPKTLRILLNQDEGADKGITELGREVIEKFLDNKVLIDIKHMSRKSRREYYRMLEDDKYRDIPIIASHCSVNGYHDVYSDEELNDEHGVFSGLDVNIFDNEIVIISRSGGIIGIQLDERRTASKKELDRVKKDMPEKEKLTILSGLVWNQVEHIAKVLDKAGEPAWDCQVIGSDFDGMVNPLDGFWTANEYRLLYDYLMDHAKTFMAKQGSKLKKPDNRIAAEEIIEKLFSKNANRFLEEHF